MMHDDDDDDDDHDDVFLYPKFHQSLNKSNTKRLVYTFTLNETYRVFVNDKSTDQANNVRDTTGFWASGLYRATIPLALSAGHTPQHQHVQENTQR